jgi:endonuclease YncB( thermonuclease family)
MLTLIAVLLFNQTIHGKVVGVIDGDTIDVLDQFYQTHRIRLAEIDAPEKSQAFGYRAKELLSRKIFGQDVVVRSTKKDHYNRLIGQVYVGAKYINLEMVEEGMAWWYRQYGQDPRFQLAEDKARKYSKGLWIDPVAIPPWDYRHPTSRSTAKTPAKSSNKSSSSKKKK